MHLSQKVYADLPYFPAVLSWLYFKGLQNVKTFLPCHQLYYTVLCCLNKAVVGLQMEVGHAN
jgi:hypothetical protein